MGCAGATDSVVTSCVLPTDQTGTLNGRWASTPIPVALHAGDFTTYEASQIAAAVATWNTFSSASMGIEILNNDNGNLASSLTQTDSATLCANNDYIDGSFSKPIVIYKDATWPTSYNPNVMALTSYCTKTGSIGSGAATGGGVSYAAATSTSTGSDPTTIQAQLLPFTVAMTELNYEYFFDTSEVPDIQTILLHELGHVLGLNHSCNNTTTPGFPSCTGTGANVLYQDAVMYPVFGFYSNGQGQQRRSLTVDDEERANCLYQGG
jgi:hypothetical protein